MIGQTYILEVIILGWFLMLSAIILPVESVKGRFEKRLALFYQMFKIFSVGLLGLLAYMMMSDWFWERG